MATKTLTIALALMMGSFTATFAGTPKDAKDASAETKMEATLPSPEVPTAKLDDVDAVWFHFSGNASTEDVDDPSKYSTESTPQCGPQTNPYRCDILAYPSASNSAQPDLSVILDERKRATAQ